MKYSSQQLKDFPALVLVNIMVDLVNEMVYGSPEENEWWNRAMHDMAIYYCRYLFR